MTGDGAGTVRRAASGRPSAPSANELVAIPEDDCWRLLASVPFGRLVFTEKALPAVHPVNFVVADRAVVVRTGPGAKFEAARRGDVLAFQADAIDLETHTGWSVLVIGHASVVVDIDRLVSVVDVDHRPWARGTGRHVIQIAGDRITGRRLDFDVGRISDGGVQGLPVSSGT